MFIVVFYYSSFNCLFYIPPHHFSSVFCLGVALQTNLDKSARSKLDRSGSREMEENERERTVFGRAMEKGEVAV